VNQGTLYRAKKNNKLALRMNYSTKQTIKQLLVVRLHLLVVLSCVGLALVGQVPESSGGWLACPPTVVSLRQGQAGGKRTHGARPRKSWGWLRQGWRVPAGRSLMMGLLWLGSGQVGSMWLLGLPGLVWLWQQSRWVWPGLGREPEWRLLGWLLWQGQRLVVVSYLGLMVEGWLRGESLGKPLTGSWEISLGCLACTQRARFAYGRNEPWVQVERQADGSYYAEMCGHFSLRVSGDEPFRMRLLILFLRWLEVAGPERVIGRTRDDRAPFVRQTQIAEWFEVRQPNVSRWERYWLAGNWPDLLSLKSGAVLTSEVRAEIIAVCAAFPWWNIQQVHTHLRQQGHAITHHQVRQVFEESGWGQLRQELQRRYQVKADCFRPRDGWLVSQLLGQVETLLARLEAGAPLTPQEQVSLTEVQKLAAEAGVTGPPPVKALPWLLRVEQLLFGQWQTMTDEQVRCIYCGSTHVVRKSNKPRLKRYYDAQGQVQTVEVYRYYCRNRACDKGSFTHLPPGLTPYSPYRTETKLLALQMYGWGYSTYRRTGQALGVSSMTVYFWVSAWGHELLPVAALFGLVKSSGVVGIDEKYVLVPKNDKPADKMRRWMYVYLAVDVYTYDLLHLAIYAHNDKDNALAFLLALRAKGYQPRVVVTDLRRDYGGDIARVFPQATHHECIFHALQEVGRTCRKLYGADYAQTQPEVEQLRQNIVAIFQAKTKRTAQKRYDQVTTLRQQFVQDKAEAVVIFDFLERHWPQLVNAIESELIPKTNNAVEMVIRRFDQHYQNFCGFENIESAHLYLAVFEKLYRFTPFSDDAQPAIRGKCPLQLAGYDISQMPMTALCHGLSLDWPLEMTQNDVPN
jgi:transposase-like protein